MKGIAPATELVVSKQTEKERVMRTVDVKMSDTAQINTSNCFTNIIQKFLEKEKLFHKAEGTETSTLLYIAVGR